MKKQPNGCSNGKLATNDSTPFSKFFAKSCTLLLLTLSILVASCSKSDSSKEPDPVPPTAGVMYILNEGNYMASNSTLSVYNPSTKEVIQDIFVKANNAPLGDVPTSMTIINDKGYITISGSGKIYIIDPKTGKLTGKITGLNSPRHIIVVDENTAYVSNLMQNSIDIIDLKSDTQKGKIELGPGNFAERFVAIGDYIYTNCWSYGKKILKIDTKQNRVVAELEVGIQPSTLFKDKYDRLWTLTDGGYEGNPIGYEAPNIVCVNTDSFKVEKKLQIKRGQAMSYMATMSADGAYFYYVDKHLYKLSVDAESLPQTPFIEAATRNFYSVAIHPSGEIYMGDAVDYLQSGSVIRYDAAGKQVDVFKVGIIPGAFCFVK